MSLPFAAIKSLTGEAPGLNSAKSFPLQDIKLNLGSFEPYIYFDNNYITILL